MFKLTSLSALFLVLTMASASAQYGDPGSVTCRISPEASNYTGGRRDCGTRQIGSDGTCYCPSSAGPIPGQIVSQRRQPYGRPYGGGYGYGSGYGDGTLMRCRISSEASRYTGGSRDCDVRRVGPDGTCYCPSGVGPLPGQIVSSQRVQVCRVSPDASRYTGGRRDCDLRYVRRDGTCSCPSQYGPIPGVAVQGYR